MVVSLKYLGSYRDVFLCRFLNGVKKRRKHLFFFHNAIQTPGFKVNLSNASIKQTETELDHIEMYLLCLCEPYIFVLALFTHVGWPYSKLNSL